MFSKAPSAEQFAALQNLVNAQGDVIKAVRNKLDVVTNIATQAQAEAHYMKGLLGAVFGEIAARSDDPYKELMQILRRVRFVGAEFFPTDLRADEMTAMRELICEYAETYLQRAEAATR
jgi:hypothetical protein